MSKGRLEAFSDGVLAIIITIMVLELKIPEEIELAALRPLLPLFLAYVVSFVYIGIYWNNHHHLFQMARQVNGRVLWANLHLLFWLSLIPFVTDWAGENGFPSGPSTLYGIVLWMAGLAYYLLSRSLVALHGTESPLAVALGRDRKGLISLVVYTLGIAVSFVNGPLAFGVYSVVAMIWFIPDRRIEKGLVE
jgi:uncharacterized membrane protein